ncbi:MAG TPA: epoxyqueuosine reductase [Deltaproteobacteria bacterium]|mgnify:CR=1 FL=1|nr:epoxyqueuosine reductase [Deltaproteobacteria bacterium]
MNALITHEISHYVDHYTFSENPHTRWLNPLVGFADAGDPVFLSLKKAVSPSHAMPKDLLGCARSVVVYFLPFTKDIALSNRKSRLASRHWARAYIETNRLIIKLNAYLAERLKQQGAETAVIPPTHNFDTQKLTSDWSHRHAAWIAGLGTFGINNMLITQNGCCGRLGSIVTSARCSPSKRPDTQYCLHKYNQTCDACVINCVTGALKADSFDRHRCYELLLENAALYSTEGLADVCGKCTCVVPCSFTNPVQDYIDRTQDQHSLIKKGG